MVTSALWSDVDLDGRADIIAGVWMEKPGDGEWLQLQQRKLPLLLNLAQCKLCMEVSAGGLNQRLMRR